MPKSLLRFSRWLLIAALFVAIGGHWAVLQTFAWATMIVDYSRSGALTEAVQKTFDGRHPCQICTEIQKSRQSDKKQESLLLSKKVELFDQHVAKIVFASGDSAPQPISDFFSSARSQAPPVPPPRVG
jgi:hypothetical protein